VSTTTIRRPESTPTGALSPALGTLPGAERWRTGGAPHDRDQSEEKTDPNSNAKKDPDAWTAGDEPMTGAQASYLETLCEEAGEEFDPNLTKAEASKRIDELQHKTGRSEQR